MKKRSATAKSKAGLMVSPILLATPNLSPKKFDFNLNVFNTTSTSPSFIKKKTLASTSALKQPISRSPPPQITPTTISDLKDHVSSFSDSIKRKLDHSHSEILKEFESSQSRLSKRFKIHTQTCQQVITEAEKDHKKMSDRISESMEVMKASYAEFIKESQASAARVCKTSIPELTQSLEKSVESLRNRYGIPSTSK